MAHRRLHATEHLTAGVDPIQLATNAQEGLASATHVTAIEANTAHKNTMSGNPHQVTLEEARSQNNVLSGDIDLGGNSITNAATPTAGSELVNKDYVDGLVAGISWQAPVKNFYDPTTSLPTSPTTGDRYIASADGNGWTEDYVYEYNGSTWDATTPTEGMTVWVEDLDARYTYNGTDWVKISELTNHNDLANIQGGAAGSYYHLTQAQHNEITSFFNTTDLTGAQAETLSDGSDASTLHHHDGRYFQESEHVNASTGGADAAKPIVLNVSGLVDSSMIDESSIDHTSIANIGTNSHAAIDSHIADGTIHFLEGDIDHGSISGLSDNDHPQYLLRDGSNAMTGDLDMGGNDITNCGNFTSTGNFTIPVYRQTSEPALAADDNVAIFVDTSDSNAVYLVFRESSGNQVSVELA